MSNEQGYLDNIKLVYGVDDNPSISKKIIFGIQHIFAAFGGIIVVPLVISSSLGFDPIMSTAVTLLLYHHLFQ